MAWFGRHAPDSLFVSAVTQAEMMLGARVLPAGKRRNTLEAELTGMFQQDFAGRVLPFDAAAAAVYADVVSMRRMAGRPISQFDAQIAAIAICHRMPLATRNVSDFEGCELNLVNPWVP